MTWKQTWKTLHRILACSGLICLALPDFPTESAAQQGPADPPDKIQWLRYNDSAEGAFDIDVLLGWQDQGGMYRFGYFDARWMVGGRSLDGKVIILIDDVNVPPY